MSSVFEASDWDIEPGRSSCCEGRNSASATALDVVSGSPVAAAALAVAAALAGGAGAIRGVILALEAGWVEG
jgi:hypothetical protein